MKNRPIQNLSVKFVVISLLLTYLIPLKSSAVLPADCQDINYVFKSATVVVSGQVSQVQGKQEPDNSVNTYIDISVKKYLKGAGPQQITIKQSGGTISNGNPQSFVFVEDSPSFKVGQSGYLYLYKDDTEFYQKKYYTPVCGYGVTQLLPKDVTTGNPPQNPPSQNHSQYQTCTKAAVVAHNSSLGTARQNYNTAVKTARTDRTAAIKSAKGNKDGIKVASNAYKAAMTTAKSDYTTAKKISNNQYQASMAVCKK